MAEVDGWFESAGAVNHAIGLRRAVQDAFSASGIATVGALAVTASGTADDQVHIAAGSALIPYTVTSGGLQPVYNNASVALTIAAADATNPRHDLIIAEILDSTTPGTSASGTDLWRLRVVQGTPASSPSDPAVTGNDGYILLARVQVDASLSSPVITSGKITDLRTQARALGVPLRAKGHITGTFSGSGGITVTHSLGVVPTFVAVQNTKDGTAKSYDLRVVDVTSSTFGVRGYYDNAVANNGTTPAEFYWLAEA